MRLVWCYITFYKIRSVTIISILAAIIMTPLVSSSLGKNLIEKVSERGLKTPVLVTRRGGKIKETLSALFFLKRESGQYLIYKDFLEIEEYRYSYVMSLPYGIQKRVELGRALALAPKLILLDERTIFSLSVFIFP